MPLLAMLHLLIAIGFCVHAQRTGRAQYWMFILLMLPIVGSVAYVMFELLPELANNRRARRVAADLHTLVDPHRDWRKLSEQVRETGTVEAKRKLAEECERKNMWDEAIEMYEAAAVGIYADDPDVLKGLARALLGKGEAGRALATLDRLRSAHPDLQSSDAHLTYARALEADNRLMDAVREYDSLAKYYVGLEARTRYALLLQRMGEPERARRLFEDVVKASKARGIVLTDSDREWARVAQRNL